MDITAAQMLKVLKNLMKIDEAAAVGFDWTVVRDGGRTASFDLRLPNGQVFRIGSEEL